MPTEVQPGHRYKALDYGVIDAGPCQRNNDSYNARDIDGSQ